MSEFTKASIRSDTGRYVGELCKVMASPYQKAVSGRMAAPSSTNGAVLFVSEGSGTVSCESTGTSATTTASAVAVYDSEVTTRRGQSAVLIFQRNASGTVIKVNKVNIGRPSTDFLAAGIVSSTLTSANTSAMDNIAGSQTQATLFSVPKEVASLTSTDVLQFSADKEKHLVSNISSKADTTITNVISEHNGAAAALLRDGARSNLVEVEIAVAAGTQAAQGFIATGAALIDANHSSSWTAPLGGNYYGNIQHAVWDSKRVAGVSPFTLATYKSHLNLTLHLAGSSFDGATFVAVAMDAAGDVLDTVDIECDTGATVGSDFDYNLDVGLESTTFPIDRLAVFVKVYAGGTLQRATGTSSGRVTAIEETADISGRGIHFCVFEGINSGASLNFHAANVIAGIPDSTNAFIASGTGTDEVYDYGIINNMLLTFKHTFPRAFTGLGAEVATQALADWFELEGMEYSMQAMSFGRIGKAFKQVIPAVKKLRSGASTAADLVKPVLKEGGMLLLGSGIGGMRGRALGAGMMAGAEAIDAAKRAQILE